MGATRERSERGGRAVRRAGGRFTPGIAVTLSRYGQRVNSATGRSLARVAAYAFAGAVLLVLAAKLAARIHYDPAIWALAGWWVPPDAGLFIIAGGDVLHGHNPYRDASTIGTDFGYVYPPLLAMAASPLSLLPGPTAAMIWSVLMVAFVIGALWLLGVVDWRCYPIALICPFTREALEYGAIGPLLVFLIALSWRVRDRPWQGALASGAAIASKLFLWPLALWFFVTGRTRTGGLSIAMTFVLILLPWAAIGFAGLTQYPDLLDKVGARQGYRSYSVVAMTRALGGSPNLATAVSVGLGGVLLVLAVWSARDVTKRRYDRDRRSLTLLLATSLVLTPVVWNHYFVLLLIPVALARPRFSAPWLILLAAAALDAFDWYRASPDGDVLPLAVVMALVTCVFVSAFRSNQPGAVVT